jgi:hypothetical protein
VLNYHQPQSIIEKDMQNSRITTSDVTKSIANWAWALSVFSAQRTWQVISGKPELAAEALNQLGDKLTGASAGKSLPDEETRVPAGEPIPAQLLTKKYQPPEPAQPSSTMGSLAAAAFRFPVAVSAFAARQIAGLAPLGDSSGSRAAIANFYRIAEAAQAEFDTNSSLFAAYQLGDQAQRALIDLTLGTLTLNVFRPSYLSQTAAIITGEWMDAFESLATSDARGFTADAIRNNFTVVDLVNEMDAPVVFTADGDYPLQEYLEKSYAIGGYPALWAVEGLGENYAQAWLNSGKPVVDLLTAGKGAKLPDKSLLMMHAGAGIAFAKHIVQKVTPWSSDAEFDAALKLFLRLVKENSRPGYEGAALESLGLVTRTWHGRIVEPLTRHLAKIDLAAYEYFWHGAGRAMYFSPLNFLPGFSPFFAAEQEPPDDAARRNARAGVAWAFTVVNLRQPEIAANFLKRKSSEIGGNDAYSEGVLATLIMAGEMVPGDVYVTKFCAYKPDPKDQVLVDLWNTKIGVDCAERVARYRQVLKDRNKLEEIFRYHDLAAFAATVNQTTAASSYD